MKKLIFTFLLGVSTTYTVWAHGGEDNSHSALEPVAATQEIKKDGASVPSDQQAALPIALYDYGTLLIDWGFNFLRDCPQEMQKRSLNVRSSAVYAYYNIRLGKSHFVISPGVGKGHETYRFSKQTENLGYNTLARDNSRHTAFKDAREVLHNPTNGIKILRSGLNVSYWDFLLELRFNANKKYPKEGFFAALGYKIGMLWNASTTIKYQEDNQTKRSVMKESFNLNKTRHGAHARLGWGRFSMFYKHTLSSLFNEKKGPKKTTTKPVTVGLSIDLF